jgi:hypothetical protein
MPLTSFAGMVTYKYEASWKEIFFHSGASTITGTFGYDTDAVDTNGYPNRGDYPNAGFWNGEISGGFLHGNSFNFENVHYSIIDSDDYFTLFGTVPAANGSLNESRTNIYLISDLSDMSGDSLPDTLNLADFNYAAGIHLGAEAGESEMLDFNITRLERVSEVPLPPAIWLFGSALFGLVHWSRKRKSV